MKKWMTGALLLVLAGCGSGNKGEQAKADYNRSAEWWSVTVL